MTEWYKYLKTSREGLDNSSTLEKMLKYVCEALNNIVYRLNKNFSKLSDGWKDIINNHKTDKEKIKLQIARLTIFKRRSLIIIEWTKKGKINYK